MQRLKSRYITEYNLKYGRSGTLWRGRFKDRLIETDSHLLDVNRYIALNAKRAGIGSRPEDYVYCSYGATIGAHPADPLIDEDEVLGLFATTQNLARKRLRAFVEEADPRKRRGQTRV